MNLFNFEKDCCGCGACEAACPQKIIEMERNAEGFLYPRIIDQSKCIECLQCQRVCPIKTTSKPHDIKKIVAGISNDGDLWMSSASGGIYSEICKAFNDGNTIFVGARWNGFDVIYDCTDNIVAQREFRKSKYVSANPGGILPRLKNYLKSGKRVVFSGTPCQNQAIVNYLGNKYRDKVVLVDFACHGQGSPVFFRKWISFLGKKYDKEVVRFDFREKETIKDHVNSNCCKYTFQDGTSIVVHRDYYHHAFVNGLCMRKSCVNCKFASARVSDITLADFKNLKNGLKDYKSMKNVSTVICNTERGVDVVSQLTDVKWMDCDPDFVMKYNPKLKRCLPGNPQRDDFMNEILCDKPILKTIKKYARIKPSEWVYFNCSERVYNRFYKILNLFDAVMFKLKVLLSKK